MQPARLHRRVCIQKGGWLFIAAYGTGRVVWSSMYSAALCATAGAMPAAWSENYTSGFFFAKFTAYFLHKFLLCFVKRDFNEISCVYFCFFALKYSTENLNPHWNINNIAPPSSDSACYVEISVEKAPWEIWHTSTGKVGTSTLHVCNFLSVFVSGPNNYFTIVGQVWIQHQIIETVYATGWPHMQCTLHTFDILS